jgi:transcriptional regulator with PAS, ATPase and Fis domain
MNEIPEIVGTSRNIEKVKELIDKIASVELNTIICGETGVGKDLIVQNLYQKSSRCGKPIIKVNCAAIPDTLLESEMFGYEKGAFTGAEKNKRGKFEQAHGGVLFLDEIGEMSPTLQAKLLRTLQDGEFSPLSSEKTIKSDVWVVAATNCDIQKHIKAGKFREDLYYRLSTMTIQIDPLRKRSEDIPLLINHYFKKYAVDFKDMPLKIISKDTQGYKWPGNVRELQNVLQRMQVLNNSAECIDEIIGGTHSETAPEDLSRSLKIAKLENAAKNQNFSIPLKKIKKHICAKVEEEMITLALHNTDFNITKASKMLGISYRSLHMKIRELDIKVKPTVNHQASNPRLFDDLNEFNEKFLESIDFNDTFEPAVESVKVG